MLQLPLTQGQYALIDDEDFEIISRYNWHTHVNTGNGAYYAATHLPQEGGGQKVLKMHRLLMGDPPGIEVDHRNLDTLDNRRKNLRLATHGQNQANTPPWSKSGYKGVYKQSNGDRWTAQLRYSGHCYYLGLFNTAKEAAIAYDTKAREIFGEFAYLNFPYV